MRKPKLAYNPDEFILTKDDILFFVDQIIKYWNKHPIENFKLITGARLQKAGIQFQSEESIQSTWSMLIKVILHLQRENGLAHALRNGEAWAATLGSIRKKVAEQGIEAILDD